MDWNSSPTKKRSSVASRSMSSHWSRFVSWNSSTRTERKCQLSRSRIAGSSRSRSRAASWRSSKSSADSDAFAAAYASAKRLSSSSSSARSGAARRLVAGEQFAGAASRRDVRQIEEPLGGGWSLEQLERTPDARACLVGPVHACRLLERRPRRLTQPLDPSLEPRPLGHLQHELPTRRAKRLVDAGQHPAQPPRPVGGQQP